MIFATLCYLKKSKKTLMLLRNKKENDMHEGKYNGLGGKMEPGETPKECAIREVEEESGLRMQDPRLRGVITFPEFSKGRTWHVFIFTCSNFKGKQIESKEGDLVWVEDSDLLSLNLWEGDKVFIPWLEDDRFFLAKFIYKDGKYIEHEVDFYP
jgi:8-oxo-dGTP diphosphatase